MSKRNLLGPKTIDLTGLTFARWTVREFSHYDADRKTYWVCDCQCGTTKVIEGYQLRGLRSKSCGCYHEEVISTAGGKSDTPEYISWRHMNDRCYNETCDMYYRYGGRGITVCERWRDSFLAFLEDVGEKPSDEHSIGRIDNDGNYEPDNVEWQDAITQANNKSNSRLITYDGKTLTLAQWARELGVCREAIRDRIDRGMSIEEALGKPLRSRYRKLTKDGKTQTVSEWSRELGIGTSTILGRIKKGLSDEQCLSKDKFKTGRKPSHRQSSDQ